MNHHVSSIRSYGIVFGVLLALLVVTVGAAYLPLGPWAPVVAMTIAVGKAVLIVLFFMHLWHEGPLPRVFAASGVLWLTLLMVFLMSDYLTRDEVTRAWSG